MIQINHKENRLPLELLTDKMTLLFDSSNELKQDNIIQLLKHYKEEKYYGILGRDNNMIPFLSISDNLLLNISKKSKKDFLKNLQYFLEQFKLDSLTLNKAASSLTNYEQLVLQISRGIILNQTIILFDHHQNNIDSEKFLINIMPILIRIAHQKNATIVICTSNIEVAKSPYYDQCLLLSELFSNQSKLN